MEYTVMDIEQAYHSFFSQFGLAFEESSIPEEIWDAETEKMIPLTPPYITYQKIFGDVESPVFPTASIFTRSTSWAQADAILNSISEALAQGGQIIPFDKGRIYFTKGSPFAQPLSEEDRTIKRYVLNLSVICMTR